MSSRHAVSAVLLLAALAACARNKPDLSASAAPLARGSLDDLCRDAGPDLTLAPLDTFRVGSGSIAFEKRWFVPPREDSHRLDLQFGIRGVISVVHDMQRTWPRRFAPSGIECEIVRGSDTVLVRGRIENSLAFSVEALWRKEGDDTEMYLFMSTAMPEELRKVRRAIESARFPVSDSLAYTGR